MKKVGDTLDLRFDVKVVRGEGAEPEVCAFAELVTGPTVVSVYMRNNTGSCDKQNETLVEAAEAIAGLGYTIVGVSRDTGGSHRKYAVKRGIGYTLVSDPEDLFAKAVDAVVAKSMYGRTFQGPLRSAWILSPKGKVIAVVDKVVAKAHGQQVLDTLHGLKSAQ